MDVQAEDKLSEYNEYGDGNGRLKLIPINLYISLFLGISSCTNSCSGILTKAPARALT